MKYNNESRHTKAYTFASHTSDRTNQSLQKSMFFSDPNKIVFKKFPSLQKNKKYATHSRHSMTRQLNNDNGCSTRQIRTPAPNSTYPKGGVSCSKDSFVVNQILVFQIKFCGKGPALRVAAKR